MKTVFRPALIIRFISMFRRCSIAISLLLGAAAAVMGQELAPTAILGRVQNGYYFAPNGAYRIALPIVPAFGGMISDTPDVATFHDDFTHISIAAIPQDMTEKWRLQSDGPKRYLQDYFRRLVWAQFLRSNPKATCEPDAIFNPGAFGGTFIAFVLLPGGSMFDDPALRLAPETTPPVAKRGNMLFVKNGYIFVISSELGQRVTEGSAYTLTSKQEDRLLRDQLFDIAAKIQFTMRPSSDD
ncbi:MAG: hypothetical protein ACREFX_09465 [Opitutaceae bacterium]